MSVYNNFIGIDIGKFNFVVNLYGQKQTKEYDNTTEGITKFIKEFKAILSTGLSVLETTGGYEMRLLFTLCDRQYSVHRANTRKVKYFIRSWGNVAKTDQLDAKSLALYGYERHEKLELFVTPSKQALTLYELVQRRKDLKKLQVAEKNRVQAPRASDIIKTSCRTMLEVISSELKQITEEIDRLIANDVDLKKKKKVLMEIPGIGNITSSELLILMPELGKLTRREAASLSGLAPCANESGLFKGYRFISHGRKDIRPILYMCAMAARNSNSRLKSFYNRLIEKGKKKMVALTALMRKIIVIANARLKELALTSIIATENALARMPTQ